MLHFTLITDFNTPVAIICDDPPNPAQRSLLYGLLPDGSFDSPVLGRRWAVPTVLCPPEWTAAQLARRPMLRPAGHRMTIGD